MSTITGAQIDSFRAITLLKGLKLETMGMKMSRGPSCYSIIKREYGLKGNKQKVYETFNKMVNDAKQIEAKQYDQ